MPTTWAVFSTTTLAPTTPQRSTHQQRLPIVTLIVTQPRPLLSTRRQSTAWWGGRCPREAGSSVSDSPEIAFLKVEYAGIGVCPSFFLLLILTPLSISPQTEQIMDRVPRGPILEFYQFPRLPTCVPDCFP